MLSLNYMLPALNYSAAIFSPLHNHIVTGASSPTERAQALANHQHGGGRTSSNPDTLAESAVPRVVSVPDGVVSTAGTSAGSPGSLLCLGCSGVNLLANLIVMAASVPATLWQVDRADAPLMALLFTSPPTQPPR